MKRVTCLKPHVCYEYGTGTDVGWREGKGMCDLRRTEIESHQQQPLSLHGKTRGCSSLLHSWYFHTKILMILKVKKKNNLSSFLFGGMFRPI